MSMNSASLPMLRDSMRWQAHAPTGAISPSASPTRELRTRLAQRLSPIRLAFNHTVFEDFFQKKNQLYSALRMDEPLQLANATITVSLLEIGPVLGTPVLSDWNEELSAGSSKTRVEKHGGSLSTDVEPIPGTKVPTKSNVMPNCKS